MSEAENSQEQRDLLPPLQVEVVRYPIDVADAVIRVVFRGVAGIGSEGNHHGQQMSAAIRDAVNANNAEKVIVDVRSLDYQFGDWIGAACISTGLAKHRGICLVAEGRTLECLNSLWTRGLNQVIPLLGSLEAAEEFVGARPTS